MEIKNGYVVIDDCTGFSFFDKEIKFVSNGTYIYIPTKTVIRLYEALKCTKEKDGINWKKYTDKFFEKE